MRRYSLTASEIEAINPNSLNIPTFRWTNDASIAATIHTAAPVFIRKFENKRVENPWGAKFTRMIDMANDSGLFLDHEIILPHIVKRQGALAMLDDGREVYPLYEGKMIWHFDHRYGTYENQTIKQANKGVLPHVDNESHENPIYRIEPRYWVSREKVEKAFDDDVNIEWFMAWRDVGPTERTFIVSIIPRTAVGHVAPIMTTSLSTNEAAALVAVLSSLVVDFDARQRSNRMTYFIVEQLAILTPKILSEKNYWLGELTRNWLANRVLELSYTNIELAPFAHDYGYYGPPFRWIKERRIIIQAEIDALILHLYHLSRSQAEWLIDSFTVLRKYEERDCGEYRTKRIVLEIYDEIQGAINNKTSYQTRLDPPPGPPRNPSGKNINLPNWRPGMQKPKDWPDNIHPPI